jgi:hypothetical protein
MSDETKEQAPAALVDFTGRQRREKNLLRGPVGNKHAAKHGIYVRFSPEEEAERSAFEVELLEDLGGASTAQRALIRRASWLEIRLRRSERADGEGFRLSDEYVLSWINSQRLILCALGLERRQRPALTLQEYLRAREVEAQKNEAQIVQPPQGEKGKENE